MPLMYHQSLAPDEKATSESTDISLTLLIFFSLQQD